MKLGGVGISMVGCNPGSPSVASAVPQSYDGIVVIAGFLFFPPERFRSGQFNSVYCVEFIERRSSWTPSIVPNDNDQTVYLVADNFGRLGRAWREADYEATDLETVIQDLLTGQYGNPIRVVAFNTAERWSEDVSEDVARELRRRCDLQMREIPTVISDFVERHEGPDRRQLTLRLV